MNIQGLQKLTLLDYPGKMACTLFTAGCDLRCPFCHNASLVINPADVPAYSVDDIIAFLKKRIGILEGVAITGGEPLMQADISDFIKQIRELGYLVKLDTNGTFPKRLKSLVNEGLVDYVAMDIKSGPSGYGQCVGIGGYDISKIIESKDFLLEGNVDYEFRTTVVKGLHSVSDFNEIAEFIRGAKKYYLQHFKDSGDLISFGLDSFSKEEMKEFMNIVSPFVDQCEIRGID